MTNYNDGKWHGWNDGECPVHPETEVEYIYLDDSIGPCLCQDKAGYFTWNGDDLMPLVAFRVVKEYKEPREFWVSCGYAFSSEAQALTHSDIEPIHVREVL
jgi:hypothetical protein